MAQKHQGEHGPPLWRQEINLRIALQSGIVSDEPSEADWVKLLRPFTNEKEWSRWNAGSRRYWWEIDAYCHYVLLCSLGALYRDEAGGAPLRILPEIDPAPIDDRGRPVAPRRGRRARHKYDAIPVAKWAYRQRRLGVPYSKLESEYHDEIVRAIREEPRTDRAAAERALSRFDFIRRIVASNRDIWELAEREAGLTGPT